MTITNFIRQDDDRYFNSLDYTDTDTVNQMLDERDIEIKDLTEDKKKMWVLIKSTITLGLLDSLRKEFHIGEGE